MIEQVKHCSSRPVHSFFYPYSSLELPKKPAENPHCISDRSPSPQIDQPMVASRASRAFRIPTKESKVPRFMKTSWDALRN